MESKSITLENQYSNEQLIVSLYYHNLLDVYEICLRHKFSEKYIAEVLAASTIQKQDGCFIVESIINYVKHF